MEQKQKSSKIFKQINDSMDNQESMTHFDKFVLRTVGTLLVLGIVGIIATMMSMNVAIAKIETELKYVSQKIEESNKDRYTASMANVDKALLNSKIEVNSNSLSDTNRKISIIFKKVSDLEKEVLLMKK